MILRFAPIIRVSTEQQKDKGNSLHNQTENIKRYVEVRMITKNNGKIARNLQGISGLGQKFPRLSSK